MTPRSRKKTTPARARKETVAEDKGGQGKTQGQGKGVQPVEPPSEPTPPPDAVPVVVAPVGASAQSAEPVVPVAPTDPGTLASDAPDKGFCDNHPDVPAVLVTNFPWSAPQRFCLPCVPTQYLFLL